MGKYPTDPSAGATAAGLQWLTGDWHGERGGERIEEHWSAPGGGALMGMFRPFRGEGIRFYKFMTVEPDGDQLVLRIKHFDPGLVGWEERQESVAFVLVALREGEAVFVKRHETDRRWLIYRLEGGGELVAFFEREDKDTAAEEWFRYRRRSSGGS